jgi:hypothetical protein
MEDFQWVRREVVSGGGEATVCEAAFVEGHTDADVVALFTRDRDADYAALAGEARTLARSLARSSARDEQTEKARQSLLRLRKRLDEVIAIDFFGAPGREAAEALLAGIEARMKRPAATAAPRERVSRRDFLGRVWVTRSGVQVDRMASAWLIRRFIDPKARFRFVPGPDHRPRPGEVRFDMFQAEFTHDGDLCTFEVLRRRFGLDDDALAGLAQIVHDIDLKDAKFARPEAAGVERLLRGVALRHPADPGRIAQAGAAFDALYESFRKKP